MMTRFLTSARGERRWASRAIVLGSLLAVGACSTNDILSVQDPDVARPSSVTDSSAIPAVLAGALGDFAVAYNGGGDFNQITMSGSLSDELINTETFPTRIEVDQRNQHYDNNGSLNALFYATQRARVSADRADEIFAKYLPKDAGRAQALNLSALSIILMAENYCGDVPLSHQNADGTFTYSPGLTTSALLDAAIAKADSALGIATDAGVTTAFGSGGADPDAEAMLARVVKARALLDKGDAAGAAAAIGGEAGVPSDFRYIYQHSITTSSQYNGVYGVMWSVRRFGMAQNEGGTGLTYQGDGYVANATYDPRVADDYAGMGFDGVTPAYGPLAYNSRTKPVVIADGVEARLIEAEAQLKGGDYPAALATMDSLRTSTAVQAARGYASTLPLLTPAVGTTAQQDQLFQERAYWLYLTSHRLGDLRRLIRDYGRTADSVFPTGNYPKGGTYGTDVNSPIPQSEDNNPNFDRSSCKTDQA